MRAPAWPNGHTLSKMWPHKCSLEHLYMASVLDIPDMADNPQHQCVQVHFRLYLMTQPSVTFYHLLIAHLPLRDNTEGACRGRCCGLFLPREIPQEYPRPRWHSSILSLLRSSSNPHWTTLSPQEGWLNGQSPRRNRGEDNKIHYTVWRIHWKLLPGLCKG